VIGKATNVGKESDWEHY